jgi:CBS domain-containing protein
VDVIRVHALAIGSRARNSSERLEDVIESGILPDKRGQELKYALEYLAMVRIRHQAEDVESGEEVDNTIEPDKLSDIERRNLKEAFNVLSSSQRFLKYRYPFS